ncbi:WD repeat-containing protein 25 isoform X2 [Cyprinus carpio]|uniref:WD repeat-containing protein 25 isoform X2 n=1 Tax=Cyprinus carpio TaxID=7962 RepID=A0A9Q9XDS2_CYPCA|nr:WD repeat-containing protein 25 isoform X2 [Cyprinus carpio]
MASLVDYEDSDSETDQDPQLYHDEGLIISCSSSSSSSSSSRVSAAQSGSSGSVKRVQLQGSALRPYVPKRQRLAETAAVQAEEPAPSGSAGSPLLSQVSERVRPFLGRRQGQVELPRRMQSRIEAHQGPVNTLQWSPVDHLSHLLLSASMDRTFKVRRSHGWRMALRCAASPHDPLILTSFCAEASVRRSEPGTLAAMLRVYKAAVQQTLDVLFLSGGREFISSTDAVSRDSADRTLIAWDFETTARLSNQIFHERFTCPCLGCHPLESSFVAQTNGGYIALFSAQRPYRINKRRRYEGHKVEGFAVHCGFSADGSVLVSGSSTGSVHFYDFQSSRTLSTLHAHQHACVCAALHPIIPAVMATCDWTGEIKIWS